MLKSGYFYGIWPKTLRRWKRELASFSRQELREMQSACELLVALVGRSSSYTVGTKGATMPDKVTPRPTEPWLMSSRDFKNQVEREMLASLLPEASGYDFFPAERPDAGRSPARPVGLVEDDPDAWKAELYLEGVSRDVDGFETGSDRTESSEKGPELDAEAASIDLDTLPAPPVDHSETSAESRHKLDLARLCLPTDQQRVWFTLMLDHGYSASAAAIELGKAPSTGRVWLKRLRAAAADRVTQ
jgi:hypothetical protein